MLPHPSQFCALATDIDGTLLRSDHTVSAEVLQAIGALQERSFPIILASARLPASVRKIAQSLGMTGFYVASNGAVIGQGSNLIHRNSIPSETLVSLMHHIQQVLNLKESSIREGTTQAVTVNYYSEFQWFISQHSPRVEEEASIIGLEPDGILSFSATAMPLMDKVLLMCPSEDTLSIQEKLSGFQTELMFSVSNPGFLEITAPDVSKASGLQTVIETLGATVREMVCVGDGDNDRLMIQQAGWGVAMGNGVPALKECADQVVATNDQDGLLEVMQWLLDDMRESHFSG